MTPERLVEIKRILGNGLSGFIDELVAEVERLTAERERCAKIAEDAELYDGDCLKNSDPRATIAAAIRAGEPA